MAAQLACVVERDLACVPIVLPRSASGVFTRGVLSRVVDSAEGSVLDQEATDPVSRWLLRYPLCACLTLFFAGVACSFVESCRVERIRLSVCQRQLSNKRRAFGNTVEHCGAAFCCQLMIRFVSWRMFWSTLLVSNRLVHQEDPMLRSKSVPNLINTSLVSGF